MDRFNLLFRQLSDLDSSSSSHNNLQTPCLEVLPGLPLLILEEARSVEVVSSPCPSFFIFSKWFSGAFGTPSNAGTSAFGAKPAGFGAFSGAATNTFGSAPAAPSAFGQPANPGGSAFGGGGGGGSIFGQSKPATTGFGAAVGKFQCISCDFLPQLIVFITKPRTIL